MVAIFSCVSSLFLVSLSNLKALAYCFFCLGAVKLGFPFKSTYFPSLIIRKGGLVTIGRSVYRKRVKILADGGRVVISKGCFFNNDCSINSLCRIDIGENSIFGESVKIYDHDHVISEDGVPDKYKFISAPVMIGANCWIGSNVIILKGVTIADNVVVGAGALVRENISDPGVYVSELGRLKKIR